MLLSVNFTTISPATLVACDEYFLQRPDKVGRANLSTLQKCTLELRQLANGTTTNSFDDLRKTHSQKTSTASGCGCNSAMARFSFSSLTACPWNKFKAHQRMRSIHTHSQRQRSIP
ncbi:hypothetical protein AAHA92_17122 [Salvia divinorum]|uniref:Uncharacterized protein n=1 Tax=Salvia divinorum TaxID=28513 RepID=A0ABD1GXR2_SALDI